MKEEGTTISVVNEISIISDNICNTNLDIKCKKIKKWCIDLKFK